MIGKNPSENVVRGEAARRFTLTPKDISQDLNVSERTVVRLMRSGVIPGKKIGGVWRSTPAQMRDFMLAPKVVVLAVVPLDSNTMTIDMILAHLGLKRVQ